MAESDNSLRSLINFVKEPSSNLSSIQTKFSDSLALYKPLFEGFQAELLSDDFPLLSEAVYVLHTHIDNKTPEPHTLEQLTKSYNMCVNLEFCHIDWPNYQRGLSVLRSLFPKLREEDKGFGCVVEGISMFLQSDTDFTGDKSLPMLEWLRDLISSDWVSGLRFLSNSLHDVAIDLHKSNRSIEAVKLVELSCQAAWKCLLLDCKKFRSHKSRSFNYLEGKIADLLKEACKASIFLSKILDQRDVKTIRETLTAHIKIWFEAHSVYHNIPRPVDLVETWVKIEREQIKHTKTDEKFSTPYLLMPYLKQLDVYKKLTDFNPELSKIVQSIISNILLEEIYTAKDGPLHNSWKLIAKARESRACGFNKLNACISSLSKAISTLRDHKDIDDDGSIRLLLAEAYGLHALCNQEAKPNDEYYVEDINNALKLWLSKDYDQFVDETHLVSHNTFNLLYSLNDLLSLKVYREDLQSDMYKMMIKFCSKSSNVDDFLIQIWKSRSCNHALCASPFNDACMRAFSELDGERCVSHWRDCMARSESLVLKVGFDQSLLVDFTFLSPSYNADREKQFSVTTDQVKKAFSDVLKVESRRSRQSMFVAAQLYYDLGERLVAKGLMLEALSYAKEAQKLRQICFNHCFTCKTNKETKVHTNGVLVNYESEVTAFYMNPSAATSAWSRDFHDNIMTPYNILRCHLESNLQAATIEEILGNESSARNLFLLGKAISSDQRLPMFTVTFSCALAKLYRKQQLWEWAIKEVEGAKRVFNESGNLISCSKCRLALEATVHQEFGDLFRSRFSNDNELKEDPLKAGLLKSAQDSYRAAVGNLENSEWENSISKLGVTESDQLLCEDLLIARKAVNISSSCWHCAPLAVMESDSLKSIIQMKWECNRRRRLLGLLIALGECLVVKGEMVSAYDVFLKSISLLVSRNTFCSSSTLTSFTYLAELIEKNVIGDVFAVENASFLYIISWFSLKNFYDKGERSFIPFQYVVSGLKLAFIFSREVPELFQKVSRLLSVLYTLSHTHNQFSIPPASNGISDSQWASFFHQSTIGTNYSCTLFSKIHMENDESAMDVDFSCDGSSSSSMSVKRLAPESVTDLEGFVLDFFQNLPRVRVNCISVFKDCLLGDLLTKGHTKESAWMMFSRLSSDCAPFAIVLYINPIELDPSFNTVGSSNHSCKIHWGHTIVDEVAPHFRKFTKERKLKSFSPSKLNDLLCNLLRNIEVSWFGHWRHLLLGDYLDHDQNLDFVLKEMVGNLKSTCNYDVHINTLNSVLRCAIHDTPKEKWLCELILNKGCYIGEMQSRNQGSLHEENLGTIKKLLSDAIIQDNKRKRNPVSRKREPVILVLDYEIQMLPWESMSILRNQEVYRMPSVASIIYTLTRGSHIQRKIVKNPTCFPAVDPLDVYYLVNLENNLRCAESNFGKWFEKLKFDGISGRQLNHEEHMALVNHLANRDLFIYVGHGDGLSYIPKDKIRASDGCAAAVLAGCGSGGLTLMGPYVPKGAALFYLAAGSPIVIGNLWELRGEPIKQFYQKLLKALKKQRSVVCEECTQVGTSTPSCEHRQRIGSFMEEARNACSQRYLEGGAPVCYGVPTYLWKKNM